MAATHQVGQGIDRYGAEVHLSKLKVGFEHMGCLPQVLKTAAQAEAFMGGWKDSYAEVVRQTVRKGLEIGRRPRKRSARETPEIMVEDR